MSPLLYLTGWLPNPLGRLSALYSDQKLPFHDLQRLRRKSDNPMVEGDMSNTQVYCDARPAKILRRPIVLVLGLISLPAGMLPFGIVDTYRRIRSLRMGNPKLLDYDLINRASSSLNFNIGLAVFFLALHLLVCFLIWQRRNQMALGMRGWVWLVLLWATFAVGVAAGLYIDLSGNY